MNGDYPSYPQPAGDRFVERRAVPRYQVVAEIEVFEPIQRTKLTAYTSELGANGCFVRVPNPLEKNTVVQIHIVKNREVFKTWGRVVHTQEATGMGIAFFRAEPNYENTLQAWLADLKIQQPSHETEPSPARGSM